LLPPVVVTWSKTGKKSGTPTRSVKPCLTGPTVSPVLIAYHWFAGSAGPKPFSIQSLSVLPPMPAVEPQAVVDVEWHVRSMRPIVLEATWLSSKTSVIVCP
jgi:hypothetical protein